MLDTDQARINLNNIINNPKVITLNSDRNALKILNEQNEIVKGLIESTL